ncbi:MAG TPA: 4-(cytidine 5'-diphospho)-2-C-methyl-D-erythritol kinase [Dehalococcoidia bacterium]|nr:4-(cytidine 5'-diphospho)-2-C-methyl-D-erythritol kinase [Dehalococcoidia bacterium]
MTAAALALRAFAKINWTLEVLGRRPDGYHELRTVLQTIALHDDLSWSGDGGADLTIDCPAGWDLGPPAANLAARALRAYPVPLAGRLRLRKRIPPAAGLGGGSSDAAAVLRAADALSGRPLGVRRLETIAASLGSDVPFFVGGGTQLASGRGEVLRPLPDAEPRWLVLLTPPLAAGGKTARLFGMLHAADFTDGAATGRLVAALRRGESPRVEWLSNSFDCLAAAAFPGLDSFRRPLREVCGNAMLCGAGPSLFALLPDRRSAGAAAARLRRAGLPARTVRTVSAAESTRQRPPPDAAGRERS